VSIDRAAATGKPSAVSMPARLRVCSSDALSDLCDALVGEVPAGAEGR
jgi:hypothetical protein